eukprot:4752001-Pleurochrysis_carterae.AAC.2
MDAGPWIALAPVLFSLVSASGAEGHRMSSKVSPRPVLGYWAIRGLAEPIRLLHAYLEVDLEEHRYGAPMLPAGDRPISAWPETKRQLAHDMALPNLPYYIDGRVKLSEAASIMRYVCERRAPGMLRPDLFEDKLEAAARHDQVLTFLFGANAALRAFHYGYLPQTRLSREKEADGRTGSLYFKDARSEQAVSAMAAVTEEQILDALKAGGVGIHGNAPTSEATSAINGPFIFGRDPCAADFLLYEHVQLARCSAPQIADREEVKRFCEAFERLPGVLDYLDSDRRVTVPFNAPVGPFGASMDPSRPYAVKDQ